MLLRLQLFKYTSLKDKGHRMLAFKFHVPYTILNCIGTVASSSALEDPPNISYVMSEESGWDELHTSNHPPKN